VASRPAPEARSAEERKRRGSTAKVTTCGQPHSYGPRQVDVEAATMPTKPAEPSARSMTPSSSLSAAVNIRAENGGRLSVDVVGT
jgi:hypothetical protein